MLGSTNNQWRETGTFREQLIPLAPAWLSSFLEMPLSPYQLGCTYITTDLLLPHTLVCASGSLKPTYRAHPGISISQNGEVKSLGKNGGFAETKCFLRISAAITTLLEEDNSGSSWTLPLPGQEIVCLLLAS